LDPDRYEVVPIGLTPDGRWVLESADPDRLRITDGALPQVNPDGSSVVLAADPTRAALEVHPAADVPHSLAAVDVVFPVLHGPYGEDGTIQGLLEMAGVPYVGSGVLASAAAMDKGVMKALFAVAGLEQAPYTVVTDRQWRTEREQSLARIETLGLPVFVKPARAGSSVGITKVSDPADLIAAIEQARTHDPKVIIEAGVENAREIECGVLVDETGTPRASACAEIIVHGDHEFYDFDAKYLDDAAELIVPADIGDSQRSEIQELSVRAFEALGCEGLARCDFFLTADGRWLINEVNTMPGFTSISMYPRVWQESGVSYPELVDALVRDALRRGTGLR
jgi:D-alanine-D-alanine ligase